MEAASNYANNLDYSPTALIQRRHISKTAAFFHSLQGVRAILAEDQRIRRRAERFGLKAKHHRVIGGWSLICRETGGVVVDRSIVWQVDEFLEAVQKNPTERRLLECMRNVLKLKQAYQNYCDQEEAGHKRLWGDAA